MGNLKYRFAREEDVDLYYTWANDKVVRENSYNQEEIKYENHVKWFNNKLKSNDCRFYLFLNNNNEAVGQVRIDKNENEVVIGISTDKNHRGKGYASEMLNIATDNYLNTYPDRQIVAYIKLKNEVSYKSFIKANFVECGLLEFANEKSYKLSKKL